tara:strand:- start:94 stop:1785 length:1692 start_codon:yes stop_codon:yes gene_type:complete
VQVFACTSNATYTARDGVNMCSDQLVRANLPSSAVADGWRTETDLDGLLCVVADNSASFGAFLKDPTDASGPLSEEEVLAEIDRYGVDAYDDCAIEGQAYCEEPKSGIAYSGAEEYYSYAQPLMGDGCLSADAADGCSLERQVLLPAASPDGSCGDRQQQLPFLRDVSPFSCSLPVFAATLADLCATSLNASFLQQQLFAVSPGASASLAPSLLTSSDGTNYSSVGTPPVSSYEVVNGTGVCSNSLVSLQYLITATGSTGTLSAVAAYLMVADVSDTAAEVSVTYAADFDDGSSADRELSGRPGYLTGKPVLVADGDGTTLELRRNGMKLLGSGSKGECDATADGASLLFGEALEASCTMTMDYAALSSYCTDTTWTTLPMIAALGLDLTSSSAVAYMGAFGDSHPEATDDWVDVTLDLPTAGLTMGWDATNGQCSNMLSGIHVKILTADVGAVLMPIRKIIGAQIVLTSQTVQPRRCPLGVACDTAVVIRATTEFVVLPENGRTFDYVPPMPTIIPALPHDLFYPFHLDSSTTSGASSRLARGGLAPLLLLVGLISAALARR